MRIAWSLPVPGECPQSGRGDVVRAQSLMDGLRGEGHDVRLTALGSQGDAGLAVASYRKGVRALLPPAAARVLRDAGRLVLARAHGRRLARVGRELSVDVIVETQVHLVPSGRLASARAGAPLVLDDCSPPAEEQALGLGLPLWVIDRSFRAQAAAARALVVSSGSLADVLNAFPEAAGKIHVVPNGVDWRAFAQQDRVAVKRKLGLHDGAVVVGFVGSFQPWHRLDLLLDALDAAPELSLLLIGDGKERNTVLASAERRGLSNRIRAPGAVAASEVPCMLCACDIGVLPGSNSYGHPMKLAEYAAAGIPAVAPDLPPVREVLARETTGLTFQPGSAPGLCAALVRLAADAPLRSRLGAAARTIAAAWSWQARARAFEAILNRALCEVPP